MLFGFKNARGIFQRLVNKVSCPLIEKNMEVYVDDMIVKNKADDQYRADLSETFTLFQSYGMKLNLKKCIFGIRSGKFMGFVASNRGIKANLDKVQAVLDIRPP